MTTTGDYPSFKVKLSMEPDQKCDCKESILTMNYVIVELPLCSFRVGLAGIHKVNEEAQGSLEIAL